MKVDRPLKFDSVGYSHEVGATGEQVACSAWRRRRDMKENTYIVVIERGKIWSTIHMTKFPCSVRLASTAGGCEQKSEVLFALLGP